MFCTASAYAFAILGQVLIVFYKAAASSRLNVVDLLSIHHELSIATNHLKNSFLPILLINCVHIFLFLISNSFFNTLFQSSTTLALTICDGLWTMECLSRLWLICSTADAIRQSASLTIYDAF
jgi:hypothetical protein